MIVPLVDSRTYHALEAALKKRSDERHQSVFSYIDYRLFGGRLFRLAALARLRRLDTQ